MRIRTLKNRDNELDVHSIDFAMIERRMLAITTVQQVRDAITKRAGVKSAAVDVFFTPNQDKPPTLQRVHPKSLKLLTKGKGAAHGRTARRVIVGKQWLRQQAPELWAALVAARLLGIGNQQPSHWDDVSVKAALYIPTLNKD